MKFKQLVPSVLLTSAIVVLVTTPTKSEEISTIGDHNSQASTDSASSTQQARLVTKARYVKPITEIRRLSEIEHPFKNAQMLLVQSPAQETAPSSEVVQVTGVKANPTKKGVEVILQTSKGQALQLVNRSSGNSFITDIPNAQLRLPSGEAFTFRSNKPIAGVTQITVTNFDTNTIRVSVTGEAGVPTVELFDSPNEGLIFSVASTAPSAQQPQTQPTPEPNQSGSQTQPSQPSAQGDEPIELVVTGEQDGYSVPDASTATRTDTPLRDIPQSIQVIPQRALEDQQVIRVPEALRNVSGVQRANTVGNTSEVFTIRGFQQLGGNLRNGFRDNTFSVTETANLERIEVLKGPASVLYGNTDPGGVINYVTKQPLPEPFYSVEFQAGSFGLVRPSVDLTGPLTSDRTLLYRLNTAYERGGYYRDFDQEVERFFVSPVLTWRIGDRTDLTLEFEYLDDERPYDRGLVAFGRGIADIPYDRVLGEPDDFKTVTQFIGRYSLEHRFSNNWTFRNRFQFFSSDSTTRNAEPGALNEQTGVLRRTWYDGDLNQKDYALQTNVVDKFATGSVKHTLLFGVDLFRQTIENISRSGPNGSINIFDPIYGVSRPNRDQLPNSFFNPSETNSLGIYVQDQIALTDNLKLLMGGRFDLVDQQSETRTNSSSSDSNQQDNAFSPRIGIVYQPLPPISLYASYSKSFQPNSGTQPNGSLLEPERGTQYEVGIRGEFLNGRLTTNLAAYEITKNNVATSANDPNNPNAVIPVGEQRSRGIELDVAGEILPGWNIIASYAYTDAKIIEGEQGQEGNLLNSVPFNAASLWTTYELQTGNWKGLGFGLGLFYIGERQGDLSNSFELSSYLRTDASIFYRRDNWRLGINVKNLFDVDYIEASQRRNRINPGAPLTIIGTLSVEF